jgi:transcriptional regulator with XRE-family HTH domain
MPGPTLPHTILTRVRTDRGLTVRDASEVSGVHKNLISRWETGGSVPTVRNLVSYLVAIGAGDDATLLKVVRGYIRG